MSAATQTLKRWITRNPRLNICLLLIAAVALITLLIFLSKPEVERKIVHASLPAVHTLTISAADAQLMLYSRGMLEPAQELNMVAQVTGKVTHIASNFAPGMDFKKGDTLLKVDPAMAELELQKAHAQLAQARLSEMELKANLEAKSSVRQRGDLSPLAQGKPQTELAESNTTTAEAAVKLAEQKLQQTTLQAPFDGRVLARTIQLHEQLAPGMPIARIYTTHSYRVRLPITQQQLAFIALPDNNSEGSLVTLHDDITGLTLQGHILRSEGHVAQNRLIYLVALLDDLTREQQMRLLPGSLLNAEIHSKPLENVIAIPSHALRANNTVWLLNNEDRLQTQTVELLYRAKDTVYLKSGIKPGDRLITSHIAAVTENMRLRDLNSAAEQTEPQP